MPGLGRYPCSSCHYIASNRRMLARHAALIHCDKVYKCPLCPFITRYAANWYRHKRDLHGLTKLTTCETCGFLASSTPELAQHREAEHPELLQLGKYEDKYAKEKIRLTEGADKLPDKKDTRNESDFLLDIYDIDQEIDINIPPADDEVKATNRQQHTPSLNGRLSADLEEADSYSVAELAASELTAGMNDTDSSPDNLRPLRIRRSYNCDQCGLLTNNPREYLYHLQSVHGEKISVHECKYCIYASKHIQKLTRHCNLVHRQQLAKDAEYKKILESSKEKKNKPNMAPMGMPMSHSMNDGIKNSGTSNKLVKNKSQAGFFKCSLCTFQTRNKALMYHHEKKNHQKTKNFQCAECGYITNEKASYTKHIRYHSKPKLQCDHCFFKTAYKWNMDRHMKNHEVGAEGSFHCPECSFTTSTKQSYNAHVANHHDPSADATEDLELEEEMNGDNDSNDWEEMNAEDNESSFQGNDGNFDDYEFSEPTDNSNAVWKQGKSSQRNLKCQQCDFRAAWPFELKKHEENHKSTKKHHCPLCGMRFEHVAWLIKHLRRIHGDNPQAKSLAAAYDVMKPARRRPGKEYAVDNMLPMFHDVLKQSNGMPGGNNNKNTDSNKPSMLSSLLKKPLNHFAPPSVSKYSATIKPKGYGISSNVFKQPRISNYYQKVSTQELSDSKKVPTCNICGYRTRWISELQRHMRVHSQEKPFQCHKCKYVCKWKGDLNRHLMKYHGIKMPSTKKDAPKFGFKKGGNTDEQMNEWSSSGSEKRNQFAASGSIRSGQDSPLDLTLGRETFPHPNALSSPYDAYDFESQSGADGELDDIDVVGVDSSSPLMYSDYKSQIPQNNGFSDSLDNNSPINPKTSGMKYQCPRCPFTTTTVSRFHVHIVQHSNKRPFMCSVCGYNSNWEWDISKHIRLKKDKDHDKACVLLTDESGRRNYEKYEKYLVDANQQPLNHNQQTSGYQEESTEVNDMQDSVRFSTPKPNFNESSNKNCTYDFRNIGSNFEDSPINVVVTPDIPLFDAPDTQEVPENYLNNQSESLDIDPPLPNESPSSAGDAKYFHCKHCDFKHSTKRVVVSHLSSHTGLKPFRCRACGIVSNWRHVIVRHVKDVHNGYMNVVEERINFVQEGYYLRVISISGENENEEVNTEANVEKSSDQFYGCKICPYKCDKEFYMNFHMKQHRPREGAVFKCDFCPYFVKFKKTLVRHMKLHTPPPAPSDVNPNSNINDDVQPQQYENDVYDFYDNQNNEQSNDDSIAISFNQLSQVESAESSPQKIKRHVCEHCPYKTDNKTQYLYHKQFHRPNPSAPFKCNSCTYWASMQHLLTQHMRVHSDSDTEKSESPEKNDSPKQFFDFFDDKGVPEKISVVYVKKGEETVKMFKCEFCPMMNKKKANVRVHQKMHGVVINDGRYACCYCNYQCLNQGGLTNHMKVHQKNIDNELFNKYGDRSMSPKKFFDSFEDENSAARKRTSSYFCYQCPGIFKTANDLENHKKFHGCSLPLKCTYCDYRAKHKPHITQHLAVHTAEYKAKRRVSTPMNAESNLVLEEISENKGVEVVPPKKIDQMLLLEASELKAALRKTGEAAANLHKCILCPASFAKMSVLVYHVSLHGSEGEFKCNQCDYAAGRADNLKIHSSVHPKKSPVKRPLRSFPCPKCPAIFYKQDRYERHLELHGKNSKFRCDHCDYSVRFAANLMKHKKVHSVIREPELADGSGANENAYQNTQPAATEYIPVQESEEKKITYICDRCPYYQMRKDAVQSHQRRHWLRDGRACPYCDYSSMQNCFLQSHIKLHMQPSSLFPPQAFVKFESFKIYMKDEDGDGEQLIFDDEEMVKNTPENPDTNGDDNDEIMNDVQETTSEVLSHNIEEDTSQSGSGIIRKLFPDIMTDSHTDSNLSGSSSRSSKVPIVVLSDIFANDDLKKWNRKLKIPKLKISRKYPRSSSSDRSHKKMKIADTPHNADVKKSKPSLVVKIKVESSRNNKHEKTTYSVSKSSDERLPKDSLESAENTNDSTSEIVFQDHNSSLPVAPTASPIVSPINDIEENTLTSNPAIEDGLKNAHNSAEDVVDSVVQSTSDDKVLTQPSKENLDLKSEDSFSNDTVPAVSDILCEKLDCLTELSFKDSDLSLTNGDCSNPLTSNGLNLLPEEIKVGL